MSLYTEITDTDAGGKIVVTDRTQSVVVTEKLDGTATAMVNVKHLTTTHPLDGILIAHNGTRIFDGVIERQSDSLRGGKTLYRYSRLNAKDNRLRISRRVVNNIYTETTVEDIIADLLETYPTVVTGNNVAETGVIIDQIAFKYIPLDEAIKQLADITGYRWFVDAYNDLHFFETDEGEGGAVFSTTSGAGLTQNILADTISFNSEVNEQSANRVWVIGARTAAQELRSQTFTSPGERIFKLGFTPRNWVVYRNGVEVDSQYVRIDSPQNEADTTTQYLINTQNQVLRIPNGRPALGSSDSLRIDYNPEIQIIDYFEDNSSVAQYGLYEKAVKDRTIIERLAARSRGRAELKRRSSEIQTLQFDLRPSVAATTDVKRGLRYRVVIPELGIDSYWLCTGVVTTIQAPDTVNVSKTIELEAIV